MRAAAVLMPKSTEAAAVMRTFQTRRRNSALLMVVMTFIADCFPEWLKRFFVKCACPHRGGGGATPQGSGMRVSPRTCGNRKSGVYSVLADNKRGARLSCAFFAHLSAKAESGEPKGSPLLLYYFSKYAATSLRCSITGRC